MPEPSTGLQGAADRIRETAKWLTVSLAAVGGVLVAGSQLSDIGALEPGTDRFTAAIVGAVIAAFGSAVVLWTAIWTATAPATSLNGLASEKPPPGTSEARRDASLLGGYANVATLKDKYQQAVEERNSSYDAYIADPIDANERAAELAGARAVRLNGDVAALLKVASYQALAHRWWWARFWIVMGGVIAAAGIGVFAWAANPPDDVKASVVTPSVLKKPEPGTVSLTDSGRTLLGKPLGSDCPTSRPIGVLVLGITDAGPDVVVQQEHCAAIRFIVVTAWGLLQ